MSIKLLLWNGPDPIKNRRNLAIMHPNIPKAQVYDISHDLFPCCMEKGHFKVNINHATLKVSYMDPQACRCW